MTAIKSLHSRGFEKLLEAHRNSLLEALASGAPGDYPAYRQIVGRFQGLDDAIRLSEQADYNLSGDEPDVGA